MIGSPEESALENFQLLIEQSPKQTWLLGAGVSYDANIPLMYPLTDRVYTLLQEEFLTESTTFQIGIELIQSVRDRLKPSAHIEDFLTFIVDQMSICQNSNDSTASVGDKSFTHADFAKVHMATLKKIEATIRWGYRPATDSVVEQIGSATKPIVTVDRHLKFINVLFNVQRRGLESSRETIEFFTTNYDTLVEDALALNRIKYDDGFVGGGMGFWTGFSSRSDLWARVIKLHGSIDWYVESGANTSLMRKRTPQLYPESATEVMIYPQKTKYIRAQSDPFSTMFGKFRSNLQDTKDKVLFVCGYSFGDEHINDIIEECLQNDNSSLHMIAFNKEGENGLPEFLQTQLETSWGKDRVFVATEKGLYHGNKSMPAVVYPENDASWWSFSGVTELLENGVIPPTQSQEVTDE